jgi:hypothetical protein
MRTTIWLSITLALGIAGMAFAGCGNAVSLTDGGAMTNPLLATWVSKGGDVAPLLAGPPFNNVSITATFKADGSYSVESIDTSQKMVAFAGTYVTMPSGVTGIIDIKCTQTAPSSATAEGIYEIDTTQTPPRMQYEVVQTQPTNGLTPPTAQDGFGSTVYNGKKIATLIQKYSRQ